MKTNDVEALAEDFEQRSANEIIKWTFNRFKNRAAICTSFQVDGVLIIDIAFRLGLDFRVFTIDSGRLPQKTFEIIDEVRNRYEIDVEVYGPDSKEVTQMVAQKGVNLFYKNVVSRMLCCETRKARPLNKVLFGLDAWITGLRRSHGSGRSTTPKIQIDSAHPGLIKVNPLADWTEEQIWEYTKQNNLPYNKMYDMGYTSIGCDPCTRPTSAGEDSRAGRWWWEGDSLKECGIHLTQEQIEEITAG